MILNAEEKKHFSHVKIRHLAKITMNKNVQPLEYLAIIPLRAY